MKANRRLHHYCRWVIAILALICVISALPALAGGEDDPGTLPGPPPPTGTESIAIEPATPPGWVFLILGSAFAPMLLAVWRR